MPTPPTQRCLILCVWLCYVLLRAQDLWGYMSACWFMLRKKYYPKGYNFIALQDFNQFFFFFNIANLIQNVFPSHYKYICENVLWTSFPSVSWLNRALTEIHSNLYESHVLTLKLHIWHNSPSNLASPSWASSQLWKLRVSSNPGEICSWGEPEEPISPLTLKNKVPRSKRECVETQQATCNIRNGWPKCAGRIPL